MTDKDEGIDNSYRFIGKMVGLGLVCILKKIFFPGPVECRDGPGHNIRNV